MPRKKGKILEDNFIMSPKYDFVFKYIFGNEKHKDILIALLSDILVVPEEEFDGIEIINSELIKEFRHLKKITSPYCEIILCNTRKQVPLILGSLSGF